MTEVVHKLQNIKFMYEKAMKIQRQGFQLELEKVKKKLEMVESKAVVLETEVELLKICKPTLEKELAQSVYANINLQNKAVTDQWRAQIVAQAQVAQQPVNCPQYYSVQKSCAK